jgi:hypothetical protein
VARPIQFATAMKRVAKGVTNNADRIVREAAGAIIYYVVPVTPIRSGTARSNWRVGIDNPPEGVINPLTGVGKDGEGRGITNTTTSIALSVIQNYNGDVHDSLHVVNNVPYLDLLNQGYSDQAEPGWIQEAIGAGRDAARSIRLI